MAARGHEPTPWEHRRAGARGARADAAVRRSGGGGRGRSGHSRGRDRGTHRAERRREDHGLQPDHGTAPPRRGRYPPRREEPGRPAPARDRLARHRADLPVDPAIPEHERARQRPRRRALPAPRLGRRRRLPAVSGGRGGGSGAGPRPGSAGIRGARGQGLGDGQESRLWGPATPAGGACARHGAGPSPPGRPHRGHEAAGDGLPDRPDRPPARRARPRRAAHRAPHGGRDGDLGSHHRPRLRRADRRGHAVRGPAGRRCHRSVPGQGLRAGAGIHVSVPELLALADVHAYYGNIRALKGVSLTVGRGEIVTLIGANGAGKTTTLRTVIGLVRALRGSVTFAGQRIDRVPTHRIARLGIAQSPEGRHIFAPMTVRENLELGAFARPDRAAIPQDMERVLSLFPRLRERLAQKGGTLSGGEQQMLAMGRALMAKPEMLLLDEPSMGLSPILVETIFDIIRNISQLGTTILLVEQNARMALRVAHRGYVIQTGRIVLQDSAAALLRSDVVRKVYLGEK